MDALEILLRRDGPALLTLARCWLGSGPAAMEAIADAIATVTCRRDSAVDGPTLRAAVLATAIDRLADAPQTEEEQLADLLPAYDASGARVMRPGDESPPLEGPAGGMLIRAALPDVPAPYRQALLLVDVEGWRHEDAAAALGITVPLLKRRLHLARLAMTTLVGRRAQVTIAAA